MGKVISLVNEKGGSTKSTTCVHLAVWLQESGYNIAVIDADAQRSSYNWLDSLNKEVSCKEMTSADDLIETASDLASKVDFLIIDSPGKIAEITRAILLVSDLAILPTPPTGIDLEPTKKTVRLIKQAQKVRGGLPEGVAFVSRAKKGTLLKQETIKAIKDIDEVHAFDSVIHHKEVTADAFGQRETVFTMKGRAATDAAREYRKLFTELLETMGWQDNH